MKSAGPPAQIALVSNTTWKSGFFCFIWITASPHHWSSRPAPLRRLSRMASPASASSTVLPNHSYSRPRRPLCNVNNVTLRPNGDHNRIGLLRAYLAAWRRQVKLSAIPLARHQRVVLDDGLFERGHVSLTRFNDRRNHRLILIGRVVL